MIPATLLYKISHYKMHILYGGHRYWANIRNPHTFNEKILWLNNYYRSEYGPIVADKMLVKDYVSSIIGNDYIIPTLMVYSHPSEIDPAYLPERCVIKPNHSSGWIIFYDKQRDIANWDYIYKRLINWYNINAYYYLGEWQYRNIQPRIICEPYIGEFEKVIDYKFFCFNGEPRIIQIDIDRHTNHTRVFVDLDWNDLDITLKYPKSNFIPDKPLELECMIDISRKLSREFIFSRIDLYNINGAVRFGEITLHPEAGNGPFGSYQQDLQLGEMLKLPVGPI